MLPSQLKKIGTRGTEFRSLLVLLQHLIADKVDSSSCLLCNNRLYFRPPISNPCLQGCVNRYREEACYPQQQIHTLEEQIIGNLPFSRGIEVHSVHKPF